ncbi:MAG: hypothetical protein KUG58_04275 [Marinosulfonomonas sp.]|nr:hypothetical protein [Marinosulfonomonas sp.]
MKRPVKPKKRPLGADKSVPNLEDVVNSAAWADRLAQTKIWRETALSEIGQHDAPEPSDKSRKKSKKKSADHAPSPDQNTELGQDVPSIEEVLTGATWEDRLAKARIRRENIIAQRNPGRKPKPAPTSARRNSNYKDTIRVAMSGAAPVQPSETPQAELYSPAPAKPRSRRFGPAHIAAGIVVLLGLGLTIGAKITDRATGVPTGTAQKTPDSSPKPIAAEIASSTTAAPIFNPRAGLVQSVPGVTQALSISQHEMPAMPSQFAVPASRGVSLARLSALQFDQAPFVSKTPIKAAKSTQSTALVLPVARPSLPAVSGSDVMSLAPQLSGSRLQTADQTDTILSGPIASIDRGAQGNTTFTAAPSLQLAAQVPDRALPKIAPANTARLGDGPATPGKIRPLAMFALNSKLGFSGSEQGDLQPVLFGVETRVTAKPNGFVFLQEPANPDLTLTAPDPAKTFKVASNAPTFPLFSEPASASTTLAPLSLGDLGISRIPTALPIYLPQGDSPVSSQPPAPIVIPEKTQPKLVSRSYNILLSAPASLSDRRLNAYTTALDKTGLAVGQANRVTFRVTANHVRFFHPDDREAARQLANSISGDLRDFTNYSPAPELGTIEIWLAGDNAPSRSADSPRSAPPTSNPALNALRNRLLQSLRRGDHL